ncbi:hypothetical protein EIN_150860 [Entamoeba invadens IP1]|uniref:Uncharacterized protein n=1 Tax=Entamoeba invadens IP1 TaxID=370355 RepID=A0A0A1U8H2_ENTIV|nr:hypothetical protein EIN_150860 [Entamoeba invadens IP1]ELP91209.1 hypothetical protein EIN_150860 [Entamoeba invadens IP1]|eukprot:XP_004257980.1 hypothetical protein EIN_150860 [Entamoeba invadens IP1]
MRESENPNVSLVSYLKTTTNPIVNLIARTIIIEYFRDEGFRIELTNYFKYIEVFENLHFGQIEFQENTVFFMEYFMRHALFNKDVNIIVLAQDITYVLQETSQDTKIKKMNALATKYPTIRIERTPRKINTFDLKKDEKEQLKEMTKVFISEHYDDGPFKSERISKYRDVFISGTEFPYITCNIYNKNDYMTKEKYLTYVEHVLQITAAKKKKKPIKVFSKNERKMSIEPVNKEEKEKEKKEKKEEKDIKILQNKNCTLITENNDLKKNISTLKQLKEKEVNELNAKIKSVENGYRKQILEMESKFETYNTVLNQLNSQKESISKEKVEKEKEFAKERDEYKKYKEMTEGIINKFEHDNTLMKDQIALKDRYVEDTQAKYQTMLKSTQEEKSKYFDEKRNEVSMYQEQMKNQMQLLKELEDTKEANRTIQAQQIISQQQSQVSLISSQAENVVLKKINDLNEIAMKKQMDYNAAIISVQNSLIDLQKQNLNVNPQNILDANFYYYLSDAYSYLSLNNLLGFFTKTNGKRLFSKFLYIFIQMCKTTQIGNSKNVVRLLGTPENIQLIDNIPANDDQLEEISKKIPD